MGRMGYMKVYLDTQQQEAFDEWMDRKEKETGKRPAMNALVNEALRNEFYEQDIYRDVPSGRSSVRIVVCK